MHIFGGFSFDQITSDTNSKMHILGFDVAATPSRRYLKLTLELGYHWKILYLNWH